LDSECFKGVDSPFHDILIIVRRDTGGGELVLGGIFADEISNVFACRSITKGQSNKGTLPSDSACLEGAEIIFHKVLTVGGDGFVRSESCWAEF